MRLSGAGLHRKPHQETDSKAHHALTLSGITLLWKPTAKIIPQSYVLPSMRHGQPNNSRTGYSAIADLIFQMAKHGATVC